MPHRRNTGILRNITQCFGLLSCCENSNELSGFIKDGEILDQLSDYYSLKKDFGSWSQKVGISSTGMFNFILNNDIN
jgi:hypothetical protein